REDKSATEVVPEIPMPTKSSAKAKAPSKAPSKAAPSKPARSEPARSKPATAAAKDAPAEIDGVKLTHPSRVYWPDAEVTKQQLADYYAEAWDHIAPHLVNRPLALLRCPGGVAGECFFQKHAAAGLVSEHIQRMKDGHGEELLSIADRAGLM